MKQLIVNFKLHFEAEKRTSEFVLTTNATERVAHGLGIGEATVKRIMAAYKHSKDDEVEKRTGETLLVVNQLTASDSRIDYQIFGLVFC